MAKKAKPKGASEGEGTPADKPAGKKKLMMIAAAVLMFGGAGGGWLMMKKPAPDPDAAQSKKPVAFLDITDMIVNLASEPNQDRPRFLKLKVALEMKDAKVVADVQPLLPRVQDIFQVFVRELRASDLEGSGGIHRLREELLRRVNLAVFPNKVEAVLFKEVIVQ
ncbi:flagellar basal body-associated protein FliL [Enterovirga sp.]|jgi:flagellar FliL protein|uniref:flagellar basal body-associated protein FliL n=1 Tax=Enterovirga sp. TaxID=2026350 RepID=UPI00260620FE|nr:flagellar basal body-associated protein FliL [Enterovirga sp.]MDB5592188.1 flagellar basal body-associated protein FliL [Enterovirga sp.]